MNIRTIGHAVLPYLVSRSLYNSIHGFVAAKHIISGRRYEAGIGLLSEFVRSGDTVIDIGANQGLYSYYLSQLVGPTGRVYAFEPIPYNLRILARVARGRSNITIRPVGCGEKNQATEFFVPMSHRSPIGGWARRKTSVDKGPGESVQANIVRLDDEITKPVSFIKCDIEGAELFAFKGASMILERWRPTILCEIFEPWCLRFGITKEQTLKFFRDLGYVVRQISEDNFLMTCETPSNLQSKTDLADGRSKRVQPHADLFSENRT